MGFRDPKYDVLQGEKGALLGRAMGGRHCMVEKATRHFFGRLKLQ